MRIGQSEGLHSLKKTIADGYIRLCKFFYGGVNNSRESALSQPHGIDSIPPKNCNVITLTEKERTVIVGIIDQYNRVTEKAGETRLYSTTEDGKTKLFDVYLDTNGNCVFNEGTDNAVAFERLKTEFNELKDKFNNHIHITTATVGTGSVGVIKATETQSTANIDNVKVDKVFLE